MAYAGYQNNYNAYGNGYPPGGYGGGNQHSAYSFPPRYQSPQKNAASEYGQPGYSFAGGRRAMQPPGGNTSINIYGGYPQNKAQYGYDRAGVAIDPEELGRNGRNIHRKGNMYGQSAYGNQDLSYQLNIPSPAGRQPLDGRRAASQPNQPAYGYSPQAGYGSPGAYGQQSQQQQQQQGYASSSSPYSAYSSPYQHQHQQSPGGYGGGGGGGYGGGGGGGQQASAYAQQASAYAQQASANPRFNGNMHAGSPMLAPSVPAPFYPGQKGQFGGKIILQPPGGRQSINLFG